MVGSRVSNQRFHFMFTLCLIASFLIAAAQEPDCFEDMFCIESAQHGDTVDVYVVNLLQWEFTMSMDLELEHMRPLRRLPFVESYAAAKSSHAVSLLIDEGTRGWSYRFDLKYLLGAMEAEHDDGFVYKLPYGAGTPYLVGQAFDGASTHRGKYAIDWNMPINTEVRAARSGVVIDLNESFVRGGIKPSLKTRANYVKIHHRDGTIGHYAHLKPNGARVRVGDHVATGDLIGYSGNTGFSSGPHLHFEVYTVTPDLTRRTIPIRFETDRNKAVRLLVGRFYGH